MMQIKYRIIEIHPSEHQIVVRFYTDDLTEKMLATEVASDGTVLRCRTDLALDIPVPLQLGEYLHNFIARAAPVDFFDKRACIADPNIDTSMADALPLLNKEFVCEKEPSRLNPQRTQTMGTVLRKRPGNRIGVVEV
jgi:hypothetical protein